MRFLIPFRPIVCSLLLAASQFVFAQQPATTASRPQPETPPPPSTQSLAHGRLLLVLPFENHTGQASLDWIGQAFPEIFNRRLASAGFLPISRADRLYALDHLGLPQHFQPSRASAIRLAQTLDADYVVFGFYTTTGTTLNPTAQVLDVTGLKLGAPLTNQADLTHLLETLNSLAWQVTRQLDPAYAVAEQTFIAADSDLRLDAFENYVRGLSEGSIDERVRHLREAVRLSPRFNPAWLALGKAYFANQNFEQAAAALGHLSKDDPNALEADFYRGLSFFYTGKYLEAEDAFAFDTTRLPLPEVVNNQGVAAARRGKDGAPLFVQAITADPNDVDYHFNLAVALRRRGDIAGAVREIDRAVKLRPQDSEAASLAAMLHKEQQDPTAATKVNASLTTPNSSGSGPLERIKRTYNEASFRQAAFEMEQVQTMRLSALPPAERAATLTQEGSQFFNRGLILEAEREFQAALAADPSSSAAHAGLAQVRERSSDPDAARQEALKSLQLTQNVTAHLVLARIDLQANQLGAAAGEVSQALQIEPTNANAHGMKQALEQRGQQVR
ncbi:tetratricopeptide repeat protein [Alloacidobacterium dinghuense]|uniref:Tetratricopeptide repeat protein n=1 Tax=Alloacidobacterium dinghuense TaxID=2763107 RepID=A0A7G8BCX9_9BACT|nr:tetratricopeptide repeat protein [Alloacidobacterium dinghuense]QNI30399.1 tetratricopeptide repeat protein [Alloacidobacterium dinghuense]